MINYSSVRHHAVCGETINHNNSQVNRNVNTCGLKLFGYMMRSKLSENAFEQINCWVKIVETLEKVSDFGMNILTPPK